MSEFKKSQSLDENHEDVTDLSRMRELAGINQLTEGPFDSIKNMFSRKPKTAEQIKAAWEKAGSPTDKNEFIQFLTKTGLDADTVNDALKRTGVQQPDNKIDTEYLTKIAGFIKRLDIVDEIKNELELDSIGESVTEDIETPNQQLSDAAVLAIFQALEQLLPQLQAATKTVPTPDDPNNGHPGFDRGANESDPGKEETPPTQTRGHPGFSESKLEQSQVMKMIHRLVERHLHLGRTKKL